jgi:amidase
MSAANPLGVKPVPEALRGMEDAGRVLQALGHDVDDVELALPGREFFELLTQVFAPSVALAMHYGEALAGHPPGPDDIEPLSREIRATADALPSDGYLHAVAQLQAIGRSVVAQFADIDMLLTPAIAERPLPPGELTGYGDDPWADFERSGRFAPYTSLVNVTGLPAISVPIGFGTDGLPTGVQLVGRPLAEDTLLQVAAQIEEARPWADRRPAL